MAGYLADKGRKILQNGYNVIPIKPGEKFPVIKNWQNLKTEPKHITAWLKNGHAEAGVGITTGEVSFVDVDAPDVEAGKYIRDWIFVHIGYAPVRVGNAPKFGLMYRSPNPFRKIASKTYIDDQGRESRVEVLGIGQQFVSHHIHPDIQKPYRWTRNDNPEVTPVAALEPITEDQARAICDAYDSYALSHGWAVKRAPKAASTSVAPVGRSTLVDDEWGLGTDPLGLTDDELKAKVDQIPNNDWPYEDGELSWLHMLMAIWHETNGSEFGESVALEWSEKASKHTDEMFEKTWRSFGKDLTRRPITFRYALKWAKHFHREEVKASVADMLLALDVANSLDELRDAAAEAKKIDFDIVDRARVIAVLRKNASRFGANLSLKDARDIVRFEAGAPPDWLKGWVYLSHADRFFNIQSKTMLSERAFNNTYMQFTGDSLPAEIALRRTPIKNVHMHGYLPGEDEFYTLNDREYANTYSENQVPAIPAKLEGKDRENVETILNHFRTIIPDDRERAIWISWHAHIVKTRKRPNWAIVLQGPEGDGKNFFGDMMGAILGPDNVKTVNAKSLEAPHNSWAEGSLFTFIEEVRMVGHNRHDVMNSIKPLITNPVIEIHAKRMSQYNIINTAAYFLTTNFQNALPLDTSDRRYFVLMSQWKSGEDVQKLLKDDPDYFVRLFGALSESPGAIRGWLMTYKLHEEFKPLGRAPHSHGKMQMIEMNKSDELMMIEDLIDSGFYHGISNELVVVSLLAEKINEKLIGYRVKETAVSAVLRQLGFSYLGRVRINLDRLSVWSKTPKRFLTKFGLSTVAIGSYLKNPL